MFFQENLTNIHLQLFSIALTLNACISTAYGWATHVSSIPNSNIPALLQTIFLSELLFTLATTFAKLSILFFYLRLAATATYRRIIWASIACITVWGVVFTSVVVFVSPPFLPTSTPIHVANANKSEIRNVNK